MKTFLTTLCFLLLACPGFAKENPPNVLFLAVDDLNNWVGCLGGHRQAKTPNIDALAKKGVLFEQAYCAAPLCHPSRTAIMTGLRPSTTGIYGNLNWFRDMPQYKDWVTLQSTEQDQSNAYYNVAAFGEGEEPIAHKRVARMFDFKKKQEKAEGKAE